MAGKWQTYGSLFWMKPDIMILTTKSKSHLNLLRKQQDDGVAYLFKRGRWYGAVNLCIKTLLIGSSSVFFLCIKEVGS